MRDCGDCSLCCKVIEVHALKKPAGEWCKHCKLGSSKPCQIYGQPERPYACGAFQCMWTRHYDWPDSMKPSQSRLVFERIDPDLILATGDPDMPDAWKQSATTKAFIKKLVMSGSAVVINTFGEKHTFLPPKGKYKTNKQVWEALKAKYEEWQRQATQKI